MFLTGGDLYTCGCHCYGHMRSFLDVFQATGTVTMAVETVFKHPYSDCSASRMPSLVGSDSLRTSQHLAFTFCSYRPGTCSLRALKKNELTRDYTVCRIRNSGPATENFVCVECSGGCRWCASACPMPLEERATTAVQTVEV